MRSCVGDDPLFGVVAVDYSPESTQPFTSHTLWYIYPTSSYVPTPLHPPKTMAVSEANGKPVPAAPDPQPPPTLSEIPSVPLPIFSEQKTSSRRPIRVQRDPGTLSHVQQSTHRHHGTPPSSQEPFNTRQHSASSFIPQCKSDQQQQFTLNHCRRNLPQQHQTARRYQPPHVPRMKTTDRPTLSNNTSQEYNVKNSNPTGNYVTGYTLPQIPTTDITAGFTPIVCSRRTSTPHTSLSNILPTTTTPQLDIQINIDLPPYDPKGFTAKQSTVCAHRNGDTHHIPYRTNPTNTSATYNKLLPASPRTANNPIPENCGNNIPAHHPNNATTPNSNRRCIVRIRRKGDTTKPRHQKTTCNPPSTVTPRVLPRCTDRKGQTPSILMHHPTLDPTQTNSTPPAPTIASTCHTNDDQLSAPQQNPSTGSNQTTILMNNCHQQITKTAIQQTSDSVETILSSGKPSCNDSEASDPSTSRTTIIVATNNQHNPPYSRAYRYKNFCSTHGNPVKPESIWHYRIRNFAKEESPFTVNPRHHTQFRIPKTSTYQKQAQFYTATPSQTPRTPLSPDITTALLPAIQVRYMLPPIETGKPPCITPLPDTKQNQQTLPISYIREPGRPGPPWPPPPTHTDADFGPPTPTLTKPSRPFTVTRLSHARPHPNYLPRLHLCTQTLYQDLCPYHRYIRRWLMHPTMIRATLHTHDIRQKFIRRPGPQPQTAAKNLRRPGPQPQTAAKNLLRPP